MRIVHVIARLNAGGPARVIAAVVRATEPLGFQHRVLCGACPAGEPDDAALVAAAGAEVERVPGLGRTPGIGDLRALAWLRTRLIALRPDMVHTHTAKAGLLGRTVAGWLGIPCLHTYHGHVLTGYFPPLVSAAVAGIERLAAGRHRHHALTPGQVRDLRDGFRIGRPDRWNCLPPPVEPVLPAAAAWHAALAPGLPVVGFLGRLVPVKDPFLWLDAFTALAERMPVQGLVCGEGPLRAPAERLARERGLRVHWAGQVPAGEALAVTTILLMTSRNEGLPIAAVEAMGAGIPVVAPPVGGLADLAAAGAIHPADRSAEALAAACRRALQTGAAPGAAALAAALSPQALATAWAELYAATAERRAAGGSVQWPA